jgi:hypothetical protein
VVVDRLGQRLVEVCRREATHGGDPLVPDTPAGGGGDAEHLLGGRGALLDPGQQDVGERQRQGLAVQAGGEQLFRVEGVPLGAGDDVVDGALCHASGEPADQSAHLGVVEWGELHALDDGQADEFGEQRPQRVAAVQVVGPVGRDDGDRLVDQAGQEVTQEVTAGAVGPVHVLEHEEQRTLGGQLADEAGDRLEQLQPAVVDRLGWCRTVRQRPGQIAALALGDERDGAGAAGEQSGQRRVGGRLGGERRVGGHRAEQVDERQVGQADVAQVDAVAGEHPHAALGGPGAQLVEQPGLADPRVAREQDGGGAAGPGPFDVRQQAGELVGPAHQRRIVPAWHVDDRGTDRRQDVHRRSDSARGGHDQCARRRLRNQLPRVLRVRVPRPELWSTSRRYASSASRAGLL